METPSRPSSTARTHIGCVRQVNEDRFLDRPDCGLWAVADGMGGHSAGDLAATAAIRALADLADGAGKITKDGIRAVLDRANAEIMGFPRLGGATVAGLVIDGGRFSVFWIGDSRVYLFRDGALERLSHDHSVVQELIDAGALAPDRAASHPQANVVTRALGTDACPEIDWTEGAVEPGDLFLLCSDGLCGPVSDATIAAELARHGLDAADPLIRRALDAGGPDNVTLVLVAVPND